MTAALLVLLPLAQLRAADWPTAGGDAARSGYTAEDLPGPLSLQWTFQSQHEPRPAWPRSDRQPFDRTYQPVIAGGSLFFGSSADCKIYALDAATGKQRWTSFTGGPVRLAPAVWQGKVYAVSDDGFIYCLSAADGALVWCRPGGPDKRMLLGNDRMISRWPARGGPAIVDGIVYFAAGVWPSEGIHLLALDAANGQLRWVNDESGSIYMAQPHGGANANSGVSAQGHLVVQGDQLLVPTGRAVPAVFGRADGKFRYFHLQANGKVGGTTITAAGELFVNGGRLFDAKTGESLEPIGAGAVAAAAGEIIRSTEKELSASRVVNKEKRDRKGELVRSKGLEKAWSVEVPGGSSVVVAGSSIVAGGPGRVSVVDPSTKSVVWSATVEGNPLALAVADGRLYVSTDQGAIHCFGATNDSTPRVIRAEPASAPYGENALAAAAAEAILRESGITEGWCVDLGCGDGALAYELARRTKLNIVAIDSDPENVALARQRLDAAGLYGMRVTVHEGHPAESPYPDYFANLVVCGRSVREGVAAAPADEVRRLQRPHGGVACVGRPDGLRKNVREGLPGEGNWTHQYADAANTCCSSDIRVKGPLGMLWFRDSDFDMPQRHGRGPAPLYLDGRLFVEGLDSIRCVDAYNGRPLWEFPLPGILKAYDANHLMGVAGTGSNICVTADGLYVRTGDRCLRLDVATGKKLAEFAAPKLPDGKPGTWGYLACEDGTLYGSLVNTEHIVRWPYQRSDMSELFTESALLFALDAASGRLKWKFTPRHSIRHNAIAIGNGRVYLIDRPLAESDRLTGDKAAAHSPGELLALDAASGTVQWRTDEGISGTLLALSTRHNALVMGYQSTRFKLPSETGGSLTGFRASDGKRLWEQKASYITRPVINDEMVYAQGGSWDVRTGQEQPFPFKRSYGCGQLASSAHLMVFRSATLGYYDLRSGGATTDYGGIRPGCWINAIPAGGVVLVPDASAGCTCSYLNQAWMALTPVESP
jgi:outer membrane protein assembly factor BamB